MSKFKVGDIVRRKKEYIDEESEYKCETGCNVSVIRVDSEGDPIFSAADGGEGWSHPYFELVEPSQETPTLTVEKALAFLMQEGYTVSISKK